MTIDELFDDDASMIIIQNQQRTTILVNPRHASSVVLGQLYNTLCKMSFIYPYYSSSPSSVKRISIDRNFGTSRTKFSRLVVARSHRVIQSMALGPNRGLDSTAETQSLDPSVSLVSSSFFLLKEIIEDSSY